MTEWNVVGGKAERKWTIKKEKKKGTLTITGSVETWKQCDENNKERKNEGVIVISAGSL